MALNIPVDIVAAATRGSLKAKELPEIPKELKKPFVAWLEKNHVPVDTTDSTCYEGTWWGGTYQLINFSGSDPDPYDGNLVFFEGKLVGESIQVAG